MLNRPAWKRDGDAEAGEDEARRVEQRVAKIVQRPERAVEQDRNGVQGVFTDEQHDQPGDKKSDRHVDGGHQAVIDPSGEFGKGGTHSAASTLGKRDM